MDSKGRALQIVVDSGNQADIRCADRIEIPSGHRLVADKGYDSTALRDQIWDAGSCPCIPILKNRKDPASRHRGFYKLHHSVENFFQRIKPITDFAVGGLACSTTIILPPPVASFEIVTKDKA